MDARRTGENERSRWAMATHRNEYTGTNAKGDSMSNIEDFLIDDLLAVADSLTGMRQGDAGRNDWGVLDSGPAQAVIVRYSEEIRLEPYTLKTYKVTYNPRVNFFKLFSLAGSWEDAETAVAEFRNEFMGLISTTPVLPLSQGQIQSVRTAGVFEGVFPTDTKKAVYPTYLMQEIIVTVESKTVT